MNTPRLYPQTLPKPAFNPQSPLNPHKRLKFTAHRCRATPSNKDPYVVLNVCPGTPFSEIKAAYYQKMKLLHPDVNPDKDTTAQAVELNTAWTAILQGYAIRGDASEIEEIDVFDLPEAEATEIFVNPFLCYNATPIQWEDLIEVAKNAADGINDPIEALRRAGAGPISDNAVEYLTPQQFALIIEELERLGPGADIISLEACEFYVRDCLMRARTANMRFLYSSSVQ